MPRIDPQQLLKCLGVLLGPEGGIKSSDEVARVSSLMSKFSKKLVSKCIYIQILKSTTPELLAEFMADGGWALVFQWLDSGITTNNYPLMKEILELLIHCPICLERLKENNCPKVVKGLSKDCEDAGVRQTACTLVDLWLTFIKSGTAAIQTQPVPAPVTETKPIVVHQPDVVAQEEVLEEEEDDEEVEEPDDEEYVPDEEEHTPPRLPIFKLTVRDGKVYKIPPKEDKSKSPVSKSEKSSVTSVEASQKHFKNILLKAKKSSDLKDNKTEKIKEKVVTKSDHKLQKQKSVDSDEKKAKSKSENKHKESDKSPSSSKDKHHKSHSSSRDKDKDRRSKDSKRNSSHSDKDKHKDKDKDKSSKYEKPLSESEKADLQAFKDKVTLERLKTPTISSLGKIPKKTSSSSSSSDKKSEKTVDMKRVSDPLKSPTDSDVKRPRERPKTVKAFNSKFRSTGLEEEIKPPPNRASLTKKTNSAEKKSSPVVHKKDEVPPEKKAKLSEIIENKKEKDKLAEKPGGIKLIPPKPKPSLQESDMFSDALTASTKSEPRKRKRRTSGSKDGPEIKKEVIASPTATSPPRDVKPNLHFYRDTLGDDEKKKESDDSSSVQNEDQASPSTDASTKDTTKEDIKPVPRLHPNGVLLFVKNKGPKKSVRWKNESDLISVKYFELDETERVNVTRNFIDMKNMERMNEREAVQAFRKLPAEDTMLEKMPWKRLIVCDVPDGGPSVDFGKNSKEKSIQFAREKTVLQAIYFQKHLIPDSPSEADHEVHPTTDPKIIPLDDITGNKDSVSSFTHLPWPEPKTNVEPVAPILNVQPQPTPVPQQANFPPGFGFPQMGMMPQQPTNWRVPDNTEMPMPPMNFQPGMPPGPPNMFPMQGPPGPGGPGPMMFNGPGFPPMGDPNMFMPGPPMGGGPPQMPNGPPNNWNRNWRGPPPPRHAIPKGVCHHFARFGNCNRGNACRFMHPGVNCPPLS